MQSTLIKPEVKTIVVQGKKYRYYIGNQFVSVERESMLDPSQKVFTCYMPDSAVGQAIADTEGNLKYRESLANQMTLRYVDVLQFPAMPQS